VKVNATDVRPRSCWPEAHQLDLLRASLWSGPDAVAAWERWKATAPLGALDLTSWKMLPLACRNLRRQGVDDPLWKDCLGNAREQWIRSTLILHEGWKMVDAWQREGTSIIILKGAAMVSAGIWEAAERPMADFDVLIPEADFLPRVRQLLGQGWNVLRPDLLENFDPRSQPSLNLLRSDDFEVDLHCHVLHRHCGDDAVFWECAVPLERQGVRSLALSGADLLLHIVSHGMQWSEHPPFRWMADAWRILQCDTVQIDWEKMIDHAQRLKSTVALRHGLRLIREELRGPVPEDVLRRLEAAPVSRRERWLFHTLEVDLEEWAWRHFYFGWQSHRLRYPDESFARRLFTFLDERRQESRVSWPGFFALLPGKLATNFNRFWLRLCRAKSG
jgi:hypothetical protein